MITLFPYQEHKVTTPNCALFWKMGRGKTYGGLDRADQYDDLTLLIICQKSKIEDWQEAVKDFFGDTAYNLRKKKEKDKFFSESKSGADYTTGVVNYDLVWREKGFLQLENYTLILDESSLVANPQAKRTKFIKKMKPNHVILLSGTPDKGKYEELVTQAQLLGWHITKQDYWDRYVKFRYNNDVAPIPIPMVYGYKHVDELVENLTRYGAEWLDEDDSLPSQTFTTLHCKPPKEYKVFQKNDFVILKDGTELVGDSSLAKLLRERQLCGMYCKDKLDSFKDFVESCRDRIIVFYNFKEELKQLQEVCEKAKRPVSVINGSKKDLTAYEAQNDAITLVQYQAGAMGLNLQKANYEAFFTPPLSSELYEQAKKRIHRIGQTKPCFYYCFTCKGSVEEKIYKVLAKRQDYSAKLFEMESDVYGN